MQPQGCISFRFIMKHNTFYNVVNEHCSKNGLIRIKSRIRWANDVWTDEDMICILLEAYGANPPREIARQGFDAVSSSVLLGPYYNHFCFKVLFKQNIIYINLSKEDFELLN